MIFASAAALIEFGEPDCSPNRPWEIFIPKDANFTDDFEGSIKITWKTEDGRGVELGLHYPKYEPRLQNSRLAQLEEQFIKNEEFILSWPPNNYYKI